MANLFNDFLEHIGVPRRSGRYPWGSGKDPNQHGSRDFITRVEDYKKQGITGKELLIALGTNKEEFNTKMAIAKNSREKLKISRMNSLRKDGKSLSEISEIMGVGDAPLAKALGLTTSEFKTSKEVDDLRKQGKTIAEISKEKNLKGTQLAKVLGMSTTDLRARNAIETNAKRKEEYDLAVSLKKEGKSANEIAQILGKPGESSVRSLLNAGSAQKMNQAMATADIIRKEINNKQMVDVGLGAERELGVSREKFNQALTMLKDEGYQLYPKIEIPQVTNAGKRTNTPVICSPEVKFGDVYRNLENIKPLSNEYYSDDNGKTFRTLKKPVSISSDRIKIRYADDEEQSGKEMDGVIQIRQGVKDLSLGEQHYAQVRVLVDGDHYLKGMAMYSDSIPKGYDIVFNTNNDSSVPKDKVLKAVKPEDKDRVNPFGANIDLVKGQSYYTDKDGTKKLSAINKIKEEGDWEEQKRSLPSQFLSKQNKQLIDKQLNLAYADKKAEYDEISSLNNPVIKRHFLKSFADDCDKTAVELRAAALPRQKYQVILPIPSLKDNEVYAPAFNDGEKVVLVRYPHGGTFEIPVLKVNNKQKDAKSVLGNTLDAVGINHNVADRLSGADFDGDTVVVIPTGRNVKITSTKPLEDLKGFDAKEKYAIPEGNPNNVKLMTKANTQKEMGVISNLITDMTIKGATEDQLARAVKHSMVVIDAAKHELDYKQSEIDNNIAALKKQYQGHFDENGNYHQGASTIISSAKSEVRVPQTQGSPLRDVMKKTGEVEYKLSGRTYIDKKTGKEVLATNKSTKMAETKDAMTLVSEARSPVEIAYANYANSMKALANTSRKEMMNTPNQHYSSSAAKTYKKEVDSLKSSLNIALLNSPRERAAQVIANGIVKEQCAANPDLKGKDLKKAKQRALEEARTKVGSNSKERKVTISDREWEAIQAGAISNNMLSNILNKADSDALKQRATPRTTTVLTDAKVSRVKAMKASGYTIAQIAEQLHVSSSSVSKCFK